VLSRKNLVIFSNLFTGAMKTDMAKMYGRTLMEAALVSAMKSSKLPKSDITQIEAKIKKYIENGEFDAEFLSSGKLDGKLDGR
jgi:hypothetical protein